MKQILIPLCLLAMTTVGVQAQVKATKGVVVGSSNSVVYALPRTTLKVTVVVEKESIRKGPYARYAQKYLGVMAPLADKDIYTIVGGKIGYAQEADPNEVYTLENPDKSPMQLYAPSVEGFLAVPMDGAAPMPSAFKPAAPVGPAAPAHKAMGKGKVKVLSQIDSDTSFVKVQVDRRSTVEQSPESAALDAANMIFMIRKNRMELISGNAGENVFGQGLKAALDELNRLEEEYLALFLGKQFKQTIVREYDVVPEAGKTSAVVCRFTEFGGLLPSSDLSGRPILVEMTPEMKVQGSSMSEAKGKSMIYYRVADIANCRLLDGNREIAQSRVPVYQFGEVMQIPVPALK